MALIGQALTGIAFPFIYCQSTKISQNWFHDEQRSLATILLAMSFPIGSVISHIFTPLIVQEVADVPYMNIAWFVPACVGAFFTIWKVNNLKVFLRLLQS